MEKTVRRNTYYWKNDKFLKCGKIGHFRKARSFSKVANFATFRKLVILGMLGVFSSCSLLPLLLEAENVFSINCIIFCL